MTQRSIRAAALVAIAGTVVSLAASILMGDVPHSISVPLTGVGMLVAGITVLRAGRWRGWTRYTPLSLLIAAAVITATTAVAVTAQPGRASATTTIGPTYGPYEFTNNTSGRCLDAAAGGFGNGTPIQLWDCYPPSQANQMWELVLFRDSRYSGDAYQIRSTTDGHRCLDANLGEGGNGTHLQLWDCLGGDQWNQLWRVWCNSYGTYPDGTVYPTGCVIKNLLFGRVLDADWGGICCNGTRVQLWDDLGDGQANQRWAQVQWSHW